MGVIDDLARAREAFERREWMAAYDALSDSGTADLAAADFDRLAVAAYLVGRTNDAVAAWQRSHQAHLDAGELPAAIRCTFHLAMALLMTGEPAIGMGWVGRGQRLLEQVDQPIVEEGFLLSLPMVGSIFGRELDRALELSDQVARIAQQFDDRDLMMMALNGRGRALIYAGRVREALAAIDEAMARLTGGDLSPVFAGEMYCSLIEGCQEISDLDRAAELTRALSRWVESQPELVRFTGQCAVHRGQIMRARGAFADALREFEQSVGRYLAAGDTGPAGVAHGEWGDMLRLTGDHRGAQRAYDQAIALGFEPQPGLALLWLATGRTQDAVATVRRLLAEVHEAVHRVHVLPAAIEVLLAGPDVDEAGRLSAELSGIAADFGCRPLSAMAAHAAGQVLLGRSEPADALPELRRAFRLWQEVDAPYDAARSRVLIGQALRELGDEGSAVTEWAEAQASLAQVGAAPEATQVAQLLGGALTPGGLTERELEVLRLVATGKTNTDIAATLVLSEKTVARHLSNIFTKLDVTSRTAAAAYAFQKRLL